MLMINQSMCMNTSRKFKKHFSGLRKNYKYPSIFTYTVLSSSQPNEQNDVFYTSKIRLILVLFVPLLNSRFRRLLDLEIRIIYVYLFLDLHLYVLKIRVKYVF